MSPDSPAAAQTPTSSAVELTFAVIARGRTPQLESLARSLASMEGPQPREVLMGVETRGAEHPSATPGEAGITWLELPPYRGIGYNRQRVTEAAHGRIIIWVDDDCAPQDRWLDELLRPLEDQSVSAVVGNVRIPPAGVLGDSISALGFPAGGSAGYPAMFRVDADCTTYNIAAGNFAIRRDVLIDAGGWDESLSRGGEDTELSHRLNEAGKRVVYAPEAVLEHPARTSLAEFTRWFFVRGRAKRQFSKRVAISGFVTKRLASYVRILEHNASDPKIVLIAPLLLASIALQYAGFVYEWVRPTRVPMRKS